MLSVYSLHDLQWGKFKLQLKSQYGRCQPCLQPYKHSPVSLLHVLLFFSTQCSLQDTSQSLPIKPSLHPATHPVLLQIGPSLFKLQLLLHGQHPFWEGNHVFSFLQFEQTPFEISLHCDSSHLHPLPKYPARHSKHFPSRAHVSQ